MSGIIPRSQAKGTDICAINRYYYIIRSDLGCYMQTSHLHKGADISIFRLHPACQNGDHYLGDWKDYFHIIKGNSCRRVTSLETDSHAVVYSLHPNCQGGDHYFGTFGKFYIIFQEKGIYRKTTNMNLDSDAEEHTLHPENRDGQYYWGPPYYKQEDDKNFLTSFLFTRKFSFLKPASEWGVEFCPISSIISSIFDLCQGEHNAVYSVHPDVLNFLPGGLSVTKGSAFGMWENIKNVTNDSNTPVTWQKKITKKVGYNKETMTQITHNWKTGISASIESGQLAKLIVNSQFSFSFEYGGSRVSTENKIWKDATEEEEQLTFELKPKESLYLWQYNLGLGQESVLFCRDLKITSEPNPPTEVPLPPAQPRISTFQDR